MAAWLAPLLSAGASLLGNLFGGKQEQKPQTTTTTSYVDYARMVKDAEAAGFNPLTAIRNGGSAGFSSSTSTSSGGGVSTPLSSRLASGLADATQSFLANFDPIKDQKQELEARLVEAQIANLNASSNRLMYPDAPVRGRDLFGGVPSYTAGPTARQLGQGVGHGQTFKSAADALPASAGASQTPTVEKPTLTNPYPTKAGWQINPGIPDASAYEERYGESELISTAAGLGTWTADQMYNVQPYFNSVMDDLVYGSRAVADHAPRRPQDYLRRWRKAAPLSRAVLRGSR